MKPNVDLTMNRDFRKVQISNSFNLQLQANSSISSSLTEFLTKQTKNYPWDLRNVGDTLFELSVDNEIVLTGNRSSRKNKRR